MTTVLRNIESAIRSSLKIAKIESNEIVVTTESIEITVDKINDANTLKNVFSRTFGEVNIFDLSEIGEIGIMLDIRY